MKISKPRSQTSQERFQDAWSASFQEHFANPNRVGCIGKAILWKMAARPRAFRRDPEADAALEHLCICAPCMDEFGALQRKAALRLRLWILIGTALALGATGLIVEFLRAQP